MPVTIETFDAGVGTVRLAWQIVQLIKNVRSARGDAQELQRKITELYRIIRSIHDLLSRGAAPRHAFDQPSDDQSELKRVAERSLQACNERLLKIKRRLRVLGTKEPITRGQRAQHSTTYVILDQGTIRELLDDVNFYLDCLQKSFIVLEALENRRANENIQNQLNLNLVANEYIQNQLNLLISLVDYNAASKLDTPLEEPQGTEGLEDKLLLECKDYAKSALSSYGGSTTESSSGGERPQSPALSSNLSMRGSTQSYGSNMVLPLRLSPPRVIDSETGMSERAHDLHGWELEMKSYRSRLRQEIAHDNLAGAEPYLGRVLELAEKLENQNRQTFDDRIELSMFMVRIHLETSRFQEAKSLLNGLIGRYSGKRDTAHDVLILAQLYTAYARVNYESYQRGRQIHHDLDTAYDFAYEQSYGLWYPLMASKQVSKNHPVIQGCVELLISIFEEQRDPVKASAWRDYYKDQYVPNEPQTPSSWTSHQLDSYSPAQVHTPLQSSPLQQRDRGQSTSTVPTAPSSTGAPLVDAIVARNFTHLQQLLDLREDTERPSLHGMTAVLVAASCQHPDGCICDVALRRLKEVGAEFMPPIPPDPKTGACTAVEYAIAVSSEDNARILKTLHEIGAINDFETARGTTALELAIKFDRANAVKTLLQLGIGPEIPNAEGYSLFHYAASYQSSNTITKLIKLRKDRRIELQPNTRALGNRTPLMLIARNGKASNALRAARALLSALDGDDVNAVDTANRSALELIILQPPNQALVQLAALLLDRGADGPRIYQRIPRQAEKYAMLRDKLRQRKVVGALGGMQSLTPTASVSSSTPERKDSARASSSGSRVSGDSVPESGHRRKDSAKVGLRKKLFG